MAVEPRRSAGIPEHETLRGETGPLALLDGEERIAGTPGADGARFVLTNMRVLYAGGLEDRIIAESARLTEIVAVRLERRSRDRRSAVWGVIGLLAAVAVWQVTRSEAVGVIAAAVVGVVSIALLADYWLRRPGIMLTFLTPGGALGGQVEDADAGSAQAFASRFEQQRAELVRRTRPGPPSRPFGGVRHPLL